MSSQGDEPNGKVRSRSEASVAPILIRRSRFGCR